MFHTTRSFFSNQLWVSGERILPVGLLTTIQSGDSGWVGSQWLLCRDAVGCGLDHGGLCACTHPPPTSGPPVAPKTWGGAGAIWPGSTSIDLLLTPWPGWQQPCGGSSCWRSPAPARARTTAGSRGSTRCAATRGWGRSAGLQGRGGSCLRNNERCWTTTIGERNMSSPKDDNWRVVQAAQQSGSRFDRAASSEQHAPVAVGPGVGQVGQLAADPGGIGDNSRSSNFGWSANLW